MMPIAVVFVVVIVALAGGGATPLGKLVLELGSVGLLGGMLWSLRASQARATHRDRDLEIVASPFRGARSSVRAPLVALTLWLGLSLVPLDVGLLETLSPQAHALRVEAESLVGPDGPTPWRCLSLSPFLSLRSLWLWLACLAVFGVTARLAASPGRVERLALTLFVAGVVFGALGAIHSLAAIAKGASASGADSTVLPGTIGGFSNRNHYAAFMAMLLPCGLGYVVAHRARMASRSEVQKRAGGWWRRANALSLEALAQSWLLGLGLVILCLGLVLSLSRAALAISLVAWAAFALSSELGSTSRRIVERGRSRRLHLALVLAVVAGVLWVGAEPLMRSFELLPEDWASASSRRQVWADSTRIAGDFWLTGTGLSSFAYVFPIYRSFGGEVFWSWAHNDYLQLLVELGVPGIAMLAWLMAAVGVRALRVRSSVARDPSLFVLHAGFCASLLAVALHSFTDFSLHLPANLALLAVVLGAVVGMAPRARTSRPRERGA